MNQLEAAWKQIAASPSGDVGLSARRLHPNARVELFAALNQPDNAPAVFANLRKRAVAEAGTFPVSSGFEVRIEVSDKGPAYARVLLQLTSKHYRDVFSVLAEDVLDCMAGALDDHGAAAAMKERLRRWQDFLRLHGPDGMSEPAQQGLFGELWFLREYAMKIIRAAAAVKAWSGPQRMNQDFQFTGGAVEVKSTASNPHHQVRVSNVRQLDETRAGALVLLHVALEKRTEEGESLEDMVADMRFLLDAAGLPLADFNSKLEEYGYLDVHGPRYRETRYLVRSHTFYRVEGNFPRLTEGALPNGVGDVTYSVALAACADFGLAKATFTMLLGGWGS